MPTMESVETGNVQIRPFTMADMPAVVELRLHARKTEPHAFPRSFEEEARKTREQWTQRFEKTLGSGATHILELASVGNRIVGMVGAREIEEGIWDLHGVYVHPDFRGQHIASRLVRTVVEEIKARPSARLIRFQALVEQTTAVEMYKSLGFQMVDTTKRRTGDGVERDAYVFEMDLSREGSA